MKLTACERAVPIRWSKFRGIGLDQMEDRYGNGYVSDTEMAAYCWAWRNSIGHFAAHVTVQGFVDGRLQELAARGEWDTFWARIEALVSEEAGR